MREPDRTFDCRAASRSTHPRSTPPSPAESSLARQPPHRVLRRSRARLHVRLGERLVAAPPLAHLGFACPRCRPHPGLHATPHLAATSGGSAVRTFLSRQGDLRQTCVGSSKSGRSADTCYLWRAPSVSRRGRHHRRTPPALGVAHAAPNASPPKARDALPDFLASTPIVAPSVLVRADAPSEYPSTPRSLRMTTMFFR